MGIINLTPDSFSDGGEFCTIEKVLKQVNYFSGINVPIEKLNSGHYHIIIQYRNQVAFKPFVKK